VPTTPAAKAVALTDKLHQHLQAAAPPGKMEALANVLLYLALTDGRTTQQALDLIQRLGLGGAQDLQNRGW